LKADGSEFDAIAEDYERVRETYPDALVDAACARGGLTAGSRVLEIGCGTGQLTEALVRRGLVVEAVDTGARLIERARGRTGAGVVFHLGRFEDVELPEGAYDAVFSATAFHWIDPAVGWSKAARLLRSRGMLALLQTGTGAATTTLAEDVVAVWRDVRGGVEPTWTLRDPFELWQGFHDRRGNVSEGWSWLSRHELARPEAGELFDCVEVLGAPTPSEFSADEFLRRTRTTSSYLRLDKAQRLLLEDGLRRAIERAGGVARYADWAVLVTAFRRRVDPAPA